jgi:DNA-binding transcriptional LysR family regulator
MAGALSNEDFERLGHVAVHVGSNHITSFADRQLERMGRNRRVALTCGCFTVLPFLLVGTERLAVLHERLARQVVAQFPLALAELPFSFPVMRDMIQYHRTRGSDARLTWLRTQLKDQVARPPS